MSLHLTNPDIKLLCLQKLSNIHPYYISFTMYTKQNEPRTHWFITVSDFISCDLLFVRIHLSFYFSNKTGRSPLLFIHNLIRTNIHLFLWSRPLNLTLQSPDVLRSISVFPSTLVDPFNTVVPFHLLSWVVLGFLRHQSPTYLVLLKCFLSLFHGRHSTFF